LKSAVSAVQVCLSAPPPRTRSSSGSGSVGRASPCQGEGRGFESRLPLHSFHAANPDWLQPINRASAPSSSGRTADFGSVRRGSNPRGAASLTETPVPLPAEPPPQGGPRPRRRTQVVKGGVCKTPIQRFDPARRLHFPS